jgi:hypothetical protein
MENHLASGASNRSQRAQRFAIQAPLRYRESNDVEWLEGRTENISDSGVLFRALEILQPDTPVELTFVLPVKNRGAGGATVFCHGRTVRTILPAATDESPSIAVKILKYRLNRGE